MFFYQPVISNSLRQLFGVGLSLVLWTNAISSLTIAGVPVNPVPPRAARSDDNDREGARSIITRDAQATATVQFTSATYSVGEGDGRVTIIVTRTGDTTGTTSVDYRTAPDATAMPCAALSGIASERCDFATSLDTLNFAPNEISKSFTVPIIDDARVEGTETFNISLSNPVGASLGTPATTTIIILDNDTAPTLSNPVDSTSFFVRQQYLDFLSREPEAGEPWSGLLNSCADPFNTDPNSPLAKCDRINVSSSFFRSTEFQLKGFFVYRFYKVAFGQLPDYADIIPDMRAVTGATTQEVFDKKAAFTNAFVQRTKFVNAYGTLSNASYVATLMSRYNLTQITTPDPANPDGAQKVTLTSNSLVNQLGAGTITRAQVLRAIADSDEVSQLEFNQAFVAMQYYGYLRRTPETGGYNDWLTYLNAHPGDYRTMINGFMNSLEYRQRFNILDFTNQAPTVNAGANQTISLPNTLALNGFVRDDGLPQGNSLSISWAKVSGAGSVIFSNANTASTTVTFSAPGTYVLRLTASDGQLTSTSDVTVVVNPSTMQPPPDPATVAPPIDGTVATTIGAATEFLYTGADPIQTGVAPGTIKPQRAAVLRGRVLDKNDQPVPNVAITILNHTEFGSTRSRADGMFDMAVNGGGLLTVNYAKAGFLAAQRQMNVPWQDYMIAPDVVLLPFDDRVTAIDLSASTPVQVAQGTMMSDSSGSRRAVLMFKQGTTAMMTLPDNTTQSLPIMHVRATEYTVGQTGPAAMPGDLPATSGYTYATEFGVDEAVTAGAKSVQFSQPVSSYVENFLGFPVGIDVPSGSYDRETGVWTPLPSGRVVKMLSVTGGSADLDIDGSGGAASDAALAALGINSAERQQLATLYNVGQTLWRVPLMHFSPLDCNWVNRPGEIDINHEKATRDDKDDCEHQVRRSIIECESQTLGESINVVGTSFALNYRSDRVPGRTAGYTLTIPVSGATVPSKLKRIDLEVSVAGRLFTQNFSNAPSQTTTFTWDGKDAYGRTLQGKQAVEIRVGYVYDGFYSGTPVFGAYGDGTILSGNASRLEVTATQVQRLNIGAIDARGMELGAWTLDPHHIYDPIDQVLYLGDGTQRNTASTPGIISTAAGGGTPADGVGDGLPATQAQLGQPNSVLLSVALAPDGSLYIADTSSNRIRKVAPNGIITTVAGTGAAGFGGDGGPATQATLNQPRNLALAPDGSLYISDSSNNRIRKVAPTGIITTVAGTGVACTSPNACDDGVPATQARLNSPTSIAFAPDGSLYMIENDAVRRVGPDGIITTLGQAFANSRHNSAPRDQRTSPVKTSSNRIPLCCPIAVAVGPDGLLYIGDNGEISRIDPDGSEVTVAGGGFPPDNLGDGLPATQARISPLAFAIAPDGSLFIAEAGAGRIRLIGHDGIISTIAGPGNINGGRGDGGPAPQAQFGATSVAVGPDGGVYIADPSDGRIRKIASPLPRFSGSDIAIASEDGSELYEFNSVGQHLRTINTLTGATLYSFTYDSAGRLTRLTDGDGNVTTIERNAGGDPTAIVAPFGQRTALALDANGFLSNVTDPANQSYHLGYTAAGLLTSMRDPRGNASSFIYDAGGRLMKDTDAASGFTALARTGQGQQFSVALTTGLNRTTNYQVQTAATGDRVNVATNEAGLQTRFLRRTSGVNTLTTPDGTVDTLTQGGDPRWGMQTPLAAVFNITTPGGLNFNQTFSRVVSLSNPADPLSLATQSDTLNVNGQSYTSIFTAANKTFAHTTPTGRQGASAIDVQGRTTQTQFGGLNASNYAYDTHGRLSTATFGAGAEARTYNLSYDGNGFLSSYVDPLGRTESFTRDAAGRVTQQTLRDGRVIGYSYDQNGNLTSITPPGRPAHAFTYTPVDLASSYTAPNVGGSSQTVYAYNSDRQLTTVTRPDAQTVNLNYDAAGRLSTLNIPGGQLSYSYSATTGRLAGITAPGGNTLSYIFDGALLTRTTWVGTVAGNVSRTFDNFFRLSSQSINGANTVNFQYDNDSLLTAAGSLTLTRNSQNGLVSGTTLGSVTDAIAYNGFAEPTTYTASFNSTQLLNEQYTRDKLGRITQKVETVGGMTNAYAYTYDQAGRLTNVTLNNAPNPLMSYTYDSNSNRLSYNFGGMVVNATYDAQDRLTQYGATTYGYNANGELQSKTAGGQATAYSYDVLGNLTHVTLPNATQIDYVIDGQQRRIGKKVNGALVQGFLYQNNLAPVAELDGANNLVSRFVYGSRDNVPDYMIKNGTTYRLIADHLGSVRLVVDVSTGAVAQRMDYDEFGVVLTDTNPGFQPFGFAGGLYDRDTGLTRFGARDYDAQTGRWTTKDSVLFNGGDTNLYGYVLDDPINRLDSTGKNGLVIGGILITAIVVILGLDYFHKLPPCFLTHTGSIFFPLPPPPTPQPDSGVTIFDTRGNGNNSAGDNFNRYPSSVIPNGGQMSEQGINDLKSLGRVQQGP